VPYKKKASITDDNVIKLACESQLTEMLFKLIIILFLRLNFLTLSPPRALTPHTPNSEAPDSIKLSFYTLYEPLRLI